MTKPSRSASYGRLAFCGSSAPLVDSALQALKPAIPILQIAASAPPATITSASPNMIKRDASPIACAPVEHAVTTEWFGPLKPYLIDTWPEIRLINAPGTKNGLTRRGPFSSINTAVLAIEFNPPIPEPIKTPVRSRSSFSVGIQPESSTACWAAAKPNWMNVSTLRCSFGNM